MSKSKKIIVNASLAEEIRIAIIEEGRLVDLDIETQNHTKHKGNVYKGIISNIEDSLDAAFVEFGEEKQAFLPLTEIRPELVPEPMRGQKNIRVSDIFVRGQEVVVQVTKEEIGNKGAAVTTYLSIPGRYIVLMHSDDSGGGISRKIENESARQAAREILERLSVPEGMAVIIRTAGMNASRQDLFRDFNNLCEVWEQVNKGAQLGRAPTLLYKEPDLVVRNIRDYFSPDVAQIVIDDEEEYEDVYQHFSSYMPDLVKVLERYRKKEPVFQHYNIEQAIEQLFERQVQLPSGGYVIIEQTEALVSIDVNSGKHTKEEGHELTVYKTNLEACEEIARQLRLRDLGGIVVVDFIDMLSPKHRRDIEYRLKELMRSDKARVKIGRLSENGTLELTRQRLRQSHRLVSQVTCEHCKGTGRVRDANGRAVLALRQIMSYLSKKRVPLASLNVKLPLDVANVLNNYKRRELLDLGSFYDTQLLILGEPHLFDSAILFEEERRGQAGLEASAHNRDIWDDTAGTHKKRKVNDHPLPRRNLPPPTIGPVPTFLDLDQPIEEWVNEKPKAQKSEKLHFQDPLENALFGDAEEMDFSFIVTEADLNGMDSPNAGEALAGSMEDSQEETSDKSEMVTAEQKSNLDPQKKSFRYYKKRKRGFKKHNHHNNQTTLSNGENS